MAITGLLGGNIPDWLGDWLLDPSSSQAYTSTTPTWLSDWAFKYPGYRQTTSALSPYRTQVFYSPLVKGAQGLFDSLGGDPQDGPGGTGISGPGAVSPTGMESTATTATGKSISELATLASIGFENQTQKALMQTVAALAPVPGISAVVGLGTLANEAAAREEISKIVDFAFLDEFSDEEFAALQAVANQSFFGGMFDDEPLAELAGLFGQIGDQEGYGVSNYGEDEISEAQELGLEPFGGLGISPDAAAVSGLDDSGDPGDDGGGPDAGDPGAGDCFVKGTKVTMSDGSLKNIEDLCIGDYVATFKEDDRRWHTKLLSSSPIVSLQVGLEEIWVLNDTGVSKEEWVIRGNGEPARVKWLKVGDTILNGSGEKVQVKKVEPKGTKEPVFNFMTDEHYNYIADDIRTVRGMAVRGSNMKQPTPGRTMKESFQIVFGMSFNDYYGD